MATNRATHSWHDAWKSYTDTRVLGMLLLGFAAGLPLPLTGATLTYWLREAEVTATVIGFFGWAGIFYSVKVFWSPIVDRAPIPFLSRYLGQRRAWILCSQAGIVIGLVAISYINPAHNILLFAGATAFVAFCSATQDIAVDAYRIEAVDASLQAPMAAMYQTGARIAASLIGGALALYLAEWFSWHTSYLVMMLSMLVGVVTVLFVREPPHNVNRQTYMEEQRVIDYLEHTAHIPDAWRIPVAWFIGAVICPLTEFVKRNQRWALTLLIFIGLYRITDTVLGTMASAFYRDMGYSKPEVANIIKIYGVSMTVFGALAGGALVVRFGVMRMLLVGAIMAALTNLFFAAHALQGKDLIGLAVVISADNFAAGFAGSAFIAYLSRLTNAAYTATQYALFSSIMTLLGKLISGFSGMVVDATSYVTFFIYTTILGIPAILLVLYLMRYYDIDRIAESSSLDKST
jgi:PAT family beta-lactamase induction signal transducer AmpG